MAQREFDFKFFSVMSRDQKKRVVDRKRLQGTTNFYPTYVDGNKDRVTPVGAVRRTEFQTVLPRYSLSMTETRNEGTGPNFLEVEYEVPAYRRNAEPQKPQSTEKEEEPLFKLPRHKRRKVRLDFWS